ncbi:MAG: DUF4177 domain-containing protein [Pseudomonadota bacterium]
MPAYDYKAVPAPRRPGRFPGVPRGAESFARTLEEAIAEQAAQGWEYLRAETLPSEERAGWLSRRTTVIHSILIFRRPRAEAAQAPTAPEAEAGALRLGPEMREEPARAEPRLGPADG